MGRLQGLKAGLQNFHNHQGVIQKMMGVVATQYRNATNKVTGGSIMPLCGILLPLSERPIYCDRAVLSSCPACLHDMHSGSSLILINTFFILIGNSFSATIQSKFNNLWLAPCASICSDKAQQHAIMIVFKCKNTTSF